MEEHVDVSIVIACYNEAGHLEESVRQIHRTMSGTRYSYELIFVDDGSADSTRDIISRISKEDGRSRFLFHEVNEGRGKAVTDGLRMARGKVAGFVDIDLETHARYIPPLVAEILDGADVACAWRIYKTRLDSITRWIANRGYNLLVRYYLGLKFMDTETGFKFFNREKILPILDDIVEKHWFWDTEIIALAHLNGLKIVEVPTLYIRRHDKKSTVKVLKDSLYYFRKIISFKQRMKSG